MAKWKCEICGNEFDNFHAQGFDNKIYCPLCYFKKLSADLQVENEELKKQLEYLRSGEYYNQLKFENKMLQDVVDNGEVSKEDRKFIDCTHRNTELLEQQQEFIKYLEKRYKDIIGVIGSYGSNTDMLYGKKDMIKEILQKYKETIEEKNDLQICLNKLEQLKNKKIYGSSKYEVVYFGEVLGSDKE